MKLNKVNKNGSLSVIIPKDLIDAMELQEGQHLEISMASKSSMLLVKDNRSRETDYKSLIEDLIKFCNTFLQLQEVNQLNPIIVKSWLKQYLLSCIEKL